MANQPFLGTALVTLDREGARKGALNKAYSTCFQPAYRGWWIIVLSGRNYKVFNRQLCVATWNVRTLSDNNVCSGPLRRTALLSKELSRYNIDIAALQETRLPDEGQVIERSGGYTIYWKGKAAEERRLHGVGFAIKSSLICSLVEQPRGISERIITCRLQLEHNRFLTIISAYAPTMLYDDEVKEEFYSSLSTTVNAVSPQDKVILLGDFNARVGTDCDLWPHVLYGHGIGKCNSNGTLLLSFCSEHDLTITNTLFRLPKKYKTSWQHPRSRHWHLLDYIITRQADVKDFLITRAMRGADCWTDHNLIRSRLSLKVAPVRRRIPKPGKKINVDRLKNTVVNDELQNQLFSRLNQINDDQLTTNEYCDRFHATLRSTAEEVLGVVKRKHQDWFDESDTIITELLHEKRVAFHAYLANKNSVQAKLKYTHLRSEVQRKLRVLQNDWWISKSKEIQAAADSHNSKSFYAAVKAIYGPKKGPLLLSETRKEIFSLSVPA